MVRKLMIGLGAAATVATMVPAAAQAQYRGGGYYDGYGYDRNYRDYRNDRRYYGRNSYQGRNRYYYNGRRCSGTTGTILGAVAGGLLGRAIDGGRSRTTGTIVGAAGGALAGRAIDKDACRNR